MPPPRPSTALLLLAFALAAAPGCSRRASRNRPGPATSGATVLSAAAIDFRDGRVDSAGDAVLQAIRASVYSRDLELRELPLQVITSRFPALPGPEQRLAQLTTYARDAAFLLLVEARAHYQAPAGARARWLVHSRVSGDRPDVEGDPLLTAIDIPVLVPQGSREADAVAAAAPAIGGQVSSLLDSLLVEP